MVPDTVGLKATFMKIIYRKLCPNEEFYFFFLLQFHTDNANQVYFVQNHLPVQLLIYLVSVEWNISNKLVACWNIKTYHPKRNS